MSHGATASISCHDAGMAGRMEDDEGRGEIRGPAPEQLSWIVRRAFRRSSFDLLIDKEPVVSVRCGDSAAFVIVPGLHQVEASCGRGKRPHRTNALAVEVQPASGMRLDVKQVGSYFRHELVRSARISAWWWTIVRFVYRKGEVPPLPRIFGLELTIVD